MRATKRFACVLLGILGICLCSAGTTHATDWACSQFLLIDWGDYCTYYAERYDGSCDNVQPADDYICWDRGCLTNETPYFVCPGCEQIPGTLICFRNGKGKPICINPKASSYHGGNAGNVHVSTKAENYSPRLPEDTTQAGNPTRATIEARYYVQLVNPNGTAFVDQAGNQVYSKLFSLKSRVHVHNTKTFPAIPFYAGVRVRRASATYVPATVVGYDNLRKVYVVEYDSKTWIVRM